MGKGKTEQPDIESIVKNGLTAEAARRLYAMGEEVVVLVLLRLAPTKDADEISTPSAMVPPYKKENKSRRHKKPGRKAGHPGSHRPAPDHVDRTEERRAECCPNCGGKLKRRNVTRERYVEDIPQDIKPEVVKNVIYRDWCPKCHKVVSGQVPDAFPGSSVGLRILVLTAFWHYMVGNTLSQILTMTSSLFSFKLTQGGLHHMWNRLADYLRPWYEEIRREGNNSAFVHADETGWRVDGKTYWLWSFSTGNMTWFRVDRSRGQPAIKRFFGKVFKGVLIADFWSAYNALRCSGKQRCLAHLLRELRKVSKDNPDNSEWKQFVKPLKRILRDSLRLRGRRSDLSEEVYASRVSRIEKRFSDFIDTSAYSHPDAKRLLKRLRRHRCEILTFLHRAEVPSDNNHAERSIRGAVIMRKNSYCNRSLRGAQSQAILMSVFATLKQRNLNPTSTILTALAERMTTNILPPLPNSPSVD